MDPVQNDAVVEVEKEGWEMDAQLKARASAALVTAEAAQQRVRVLEKLLEESLEDLSRKLKKCLDSHDDLRRRLLRLESANKGTNAASQNTSNHEFQYLEERYKALEIFVRKSLDTLFVGRYSSDGLPYEDNENGASNIIVKDSSIPLPDHYFQTSPIISSHSHVTVQQEYPLPPKWKGDMFSGIRFRGPEADPRIPHKNDERKSAPIPATRHFIHSPTSLSRPASPEPKEPLYDVIPATTPVPVKGPPLTSGTVISGSVPFQRTHPGESSPALPNSRMSPESTFNLKQSASQDRTFSHFSFSFPRSTQEEITAVAQPLHESSTKRTYIYDDVINPPVESRKCSPTVQSNKSHIPVIPIPSRDFRKPTDKSMNEIGPEPSILPLKAQVSANNSLVEDPSLYMENIPYSSLPLNSQASTAMIRTEEPRYVRGPGSRNPRGALYETTEYLNVNSELDNTTNYEAPPLPPRSTIPTQSDNIPSVTRTPDPVKSNGVKALLRAVPSLIAGSSPKKDSSVPKKETAGEPKSKDNDAMETGDETDRPEAALWRAAKENDVKTCTALLAKHGKGLAETRDLTGDTPVHWSAHAGHEAVLKALLKSGADVEVRGAGGRTPLHYAAFSGKSSCISALLMAGANPEARTTNGITPLHLTALRGHREASIKLIAGGADPRAQESAGRTPAQLATDKDLRKVLEREENSAVEKKEVK